MNLDEFNSMGGEAQDAYFVQAEEHILDLPGVNRAFESSILMDCDVDDGFDQIFFKFMSDGGHTDDLNGLAVKKWLREKGVKFDSTADRNVIMTMTDFLATF